MVHRQADPPRRASSGLIAASRVEGTRVYDRTGKHLGSVHDLVLDKLSGKAVYAIMSFGGFLGIGEEYHPLPWAMLEYDVEMGGYRVDLNDQRLREAPRYGRDRLPDWEDPAHGRSIHDYYGVPHYEHRPVDEISPEQDAAIKRLYRE